MKPAEREMIGKWKKTSKRQSSDVSFFLKQIIISQKIL